MIIKNGNVHDGRGGVQKCVDILIENGKITKIGKNISAQGDVVDATGKEVLPGFIDMLTVNGATGPGWGEHDLCEHTNPVTPEMNVVYAFDHDGMNFQQMYKYATTAAGVTPSVGNVMGGSGAVFKTYGRNPYDMLVRENAFAVASITAETKNAYAPKNLMPMTKMGAFALLIDALKKAEKYIEDGDKHDFDPKSESLVAVIRGEKPLFINCGTKSEINAIAHAFAQWKKIKIVLTGAFEIDDTMDILKNASGIAMGDLTNTMSKLNSHVNFTAVKKIAESGVPVAISCGGDNIASGKESLLWNAILWYKNGFDSEQVIKMITSVPAEMLGVSDTIGSIEVGKAADIAIWSANPIETYGAHLDAVFANGENLFETERYVSCW